MALRQAAERPPPGSGIDAKQSLKMLAPTMASPLTMSWCCRIRMPSIRLVVVRIMPGSERLGRRGLFGAWGAGCSAR